MHSLLPGLAMNSHFVSVGSSTAPAGGAPIAIAVSAVAMDASSLACLITEVLLPRISPATWILPGFRPSRRRPYTAAEGTVGSRPVRILTLLPHALSASAGLMGDLRRPAHG